MKNLICTLFYIVSLSLTVQVLNTNCSGFKEDDIDWSNFSPIVDLPDVDEHDDSRQRSQNAERRSSSLQQSQPRSPNVETPSSLPQQSQSSPVYSFYGDTNWKDDEMEDKFMNEGEYWKDIADNVRNKTKLTEVCAKFSWEYNESEYPKVCSQRNCQAINFYRKKKNPIVLKSRRGTYDLERVMLACLCYNKKTTNANGIIINQHYFAVAKHSNNSYYLLKYVNKDECPYLHGFVKNFTY